MIPNVNVCPVTLHHVALLRNGGIALVSESYGPSDKGHLLPDCSEGLAQG